jgi:hypothetical protein
MVLLTLVTWTGVRLLSRYDPHWSIVLLCCVLTGNVVGGILAGWRGLLPGAAIGLLTGAVLIPLDVFLWLVFTLPPHPEVDL